jgi:hypothetical protein
MTAATARTPTMSGTWATSSAKPTPPRAPAEPTLVYSYLSSYTLGTNVENGRILATGAANLTGNSLANVLYAGVGNNVLNGSTGTTPSPTPTG